MDADQLLNFLRHARQDVTRGDAVFRCGFNGALDVVAARIREMQACDKAGPGWYCSRAAGHAGPCAAYPVGGTVDQSPRDPRDEEEQRAARTEGR